MKRSFWNSSGSFFFASVMLFLSALVVFVGGAYAGKELKGIEGQLTTIQSTLLTMALMITGGLLGVAGAILFSKETTN